MTCCGNGVLDVPYGESMEKYNKILGNYGEDIAAQFLKKNKYKIIEKNYSCKFGEIDIIAKDKNILVFVEVKSRTNEKYGTPALAVNYYKQKNIIKTAKHYIMENKLQNEFCRFDVVEVLVENADNNIRLIKNAFMA
jgi:putative endonuclease